MARKIAYLTALVFVTALASREAGAGALSPGGLLALSEPAAPDEGDLKAPPEKLTTGKKLVLSGWTLYAGGYLLAVGVGLPVLFAGNAVDYCQAEEGDDKMCGVTYLVNGGLIALPLVGPLISGAFMFKEHAGSAKGFGAFLVIDSLIQIAGLAAAIAGHVIRRAEKKRASLGYDGTLTLSGGRIRLAFSPALTPGGGGVGVAGTF